MKKIAIFAALATTLALSAHAQSITKAYGAADGVYVQDNTSNYWLVNTASSGNGIIFIPLENLPVSNGSIVITMLDGQQFRPNYLDFGEIYTGTSSGSTATASGLWAYRACNATISTTFSSANGNWTAFSAVTTAVSPTSAGAAQGMDCNGLANYVGMGVGVRRTFTKAF